MKYEVAQREQVVLIRKWWLGGYGSFQMFASRSPAIAAAPPVMLSVRIQFACY